MRYNYTNNFEREADHKDHWAGDPSKNPYLKEEIAEDLKEKLWDAQIMREACETALSEANKKIAKLEELNKNYQASVKILGEKLADKK